ncbi:Osbpl9 [Columba guinea]|nr:Osbpl9 [Columba guinea]
MASIMEGPLSKWTNVMKGWQYRWFVLDYNAGLLSYYTSKDKMMRGSRRGCVRLRWCSDRVCAADVTARLTRILFFVSQGAVIGIDDEDDSTFTITVDQKTFHFQVRIGLSYRIPKNKSVGNIRGVDSGFVPSVHDFDKKLTEADAYLQILIDQLKLFDEKLQNCKDDEQRKASIYRTDRLALERKQEACLEEKIESLKETTSSMVESIKHCIVLLQIAKDQNNEEKHADGLISTINPVDAVYQPSPLEQSVISTMPSQAVIPPEPAQLCKSEQRPSSLPVGPVVASLGNQTPTPNSTGSGQSAPSSSLTSPSHVNLSPNTVPDFSYSSSEDEFYDADEFYQSSSSPKRCMDSSGSAAVLTRSSTGSSMKRPDTTESLNSSMSNGTNDAELFFFTQVVLPTFILERRSLLEMYADFFAHPDLFVSISDQKDPKERMVQVVKWYLSAFHAGRKGSVAKKPYNPILGEIFRCHWVLPGTEGEDDMEPVSEGPVPWVSKSNVTFVAEQVSHHPPISAFYAECFNKRIQFNAHIWTKSKFLGMSIGVHNIGQGCVTCLDYDEHYILTFPNGYGRQVNALLVFSFLMPSHISCLKLISSPNDKKAFCTIEGEWNGVMYAKYTTGENAVFIDTKKMPIIKKKVRKLEDQDDFESRCLWKDVTYNLVIRDIDAATAAKHALEERQRAEARARKENETPWETRLFHEDGECWVYDEPLLKRLAANKH